MVPETIVRQLARPRRCPLRIRCSHHRQQDGLHVIQFLGHAPNMSPQLRGRLAIFGNVVHAREILRLTRIAFGSDAIALAMLFMS
jgi:hypothetical protein